MSNKDTFNKAYPIPGFVLFLIAVIVPAAFAVAGGFPSFVKTFSDIRILRQLSYSLILALCCTVSAVITGLPFAYITASYSFRARGFFRKLNALFFVFPPVLTILCFEILFGEKGFFPFNIPYPFLKHGLLLTVFNIPVIVLLVSSWWSRLDYRLETTALSLGLKPSAVFFDITLPRLRPAITGSAALVFLRCFSDIAIVNFYAKGSKFINAGSLMYRLKENGNPETAGSLSIFVTLISLFFLVIFCSSFTKLKGSILTRDENRKPLKKPKSFGSRLLVFIFIILNLAFLLAPAAAVVFKSFYYGGQFYAGAYTNLFSSFKVWGTGTFLNSLLIAFAAALISTFIALRISSASLYMNFYACLALLPLAFGSATLGLG
ncbi:MAG: ABC transporter permease, partial [Spirochaetales bacterium]